MMLHGLFEQPNSPPKSNLIHVMQASNFGNAKHIWYINNGCNINYLQNKFNSSMLTSVLLHAYKHSYTIQSQENHRKASAREYVVHFHKQKKMKKPNP